MEKTPSPGTKKSRIEAVDALRGFALFGILIAHVVEQYLGSNPPAPDFGILSPADAVAAGAMELLVRGKFFMMFSLLFGLSFFLQLDRASDRDPAFRSRFVRRLLLLFGIGMIHHLIYRGDILTVYALLGLVLVLFYHASDRTLLVTALLLFLGLPRLLLIAGGSAVGFDPTPILFAGNREADRAYFEILKHGSLWSVFASNLFEGMRLKVDLQFGLIGRGYQTLALFLIGLYVGRQRWPEKLDDLRRHLRRSLGAAVVLCLVAAGVGLGLGGPQEDATPSHIAVFLGLYDLFNLGLAVLLVAGFLLLYLRPRGERLLRGLVPVGRTALTCYVSQTIVFTFILYGWGMGRIGEIGAATMVLLGVGIFACQMLLAGLWLQRFRFGPVEWVWRTLTYGRAQPMRLPSGGSAQVPRTATTP